MSETLIQVEGLSKKFCRDLKRSLWYGVNDLAGELRGGRREHQDELRPQEFWSVRDINFEVKRGECLALIGPNGAGKSTLLRMLNGLIKPNRGKITMHGRVNALIALGAGFNPILTGRENVYINGSVL
ncbi:MAG: ATP-binding cassette domain-containing protein, partial [Gammaproteobacteria bacterium]|nr:ATP-binding cassette domain-containing protein [Gammaproteobacteria bacterium]